MTAFENVLHETLPQTAWLNPKESAAYVRLSLDNFLVRVREGRGPAYSGERKLMRFKVRDLDVWVAGGMRPVERADAA